MFSILVVLSRKVKDHVNDIKCHTKDSEVKKKWKIGCIRESHHDRKNENHQSYLNDVNEAPNY